MSGLFVYLVGLNRLMYMLRVLWCAYLAKQLTQGKMAQDVGMV